MKEAIAVLGTLIGVLVAVQFLSGGTFNIGSNGGKPYFHVGFAGASQGG